ncbi:MAG: methionine--tRNA ligase [bacterium]|nr:methionine--tRNA ligase [bacterium]
MEKFYITTAIDYVNAGPHLGHALEKTQADVIARYQRLLGKDVFFLTGTDEHGAKISRAAEVAGKSIEDFVDEISEIFKNFAKELNISNDDFIRTSDKVCHWPAAKALWEKLVQEGDIYKGIYKGLYCVGCEAFVTKKDLADGKCAIHNEKPEEINEENYFFKLSRYQEKIKKAILSGKFKIIPESRKNEVLGLIKQGLEDVSFSRPAKDIPWGIPVPGDSSQTMYVWADALTNYISALGYGTKNDSKFKKYWPADIHVIGKDILRFHALIWPGMLLSAGLDLPRSLLIHGHITVAGQKMSKSLGNVIDPFDLMKRYGTDALRYYLSREISVTEDSDLTEEKFKEAYNANLANGLGNLVSRIMKMASTYLETCPELPEKSIPENFKEAMNNFEINKAADIVWQKIGELDGKIQATEPFKLVKTDKEATVKIIKELVIDLYTVGWMLNPIMPATSAIIKSTVKSNKMPEPLFPRKE